MTLFNIIDLKERDCQLLQNWVSGAAGLTLLQRPQGVRREIAILHHSTLSGPPGGAAKHKQIEENPCGNEELAVPLLYVYVRQQSVDSWDGGFFTRGFPPVGRSGKKKKKKEPKTTNLPQITFEI